MTFTEIVTAVCDRLNLTSTDAVARIGRSVNDRHKRVTSSLGMVVSRRAQVQATMTAGVNTLTFTGIERLINVIDKSSGRDRILPEYSVEELKAELPATTGTPTAYAVYRIDADGVTILTNSIPQGTPTLYADGYELATTLSGSSEPKLPESFHDIIVHGVIADELRKMEKLELAREAEALYEDRLSQLRLFVAASVGRDIYPHVTKVNVGDILTGAPSELDILGGAQSWTQTGLITFDRDPSAPFAVTANSAKVDNLDADKLDGFDESAFFKLADNETVTGNTLFTGTVEFDAAANFDGAVDMDSTLDVAGTLTAQGDVNIGDDLTVTDDALITGDLNVDGAVDFDGALDVAGAVTIREDVLITDQDAGGAKIKFIGSSGTGAGRTMQPSGNNLTLSANTDYDGTNWNLDDTGLMGTILHETATATEAAWSFYYATAGSNPRTLSRVGYFSNLTGLVMENGNISLIGTRPKVNVAFENQTPKAHLFQAVTGARFDLSSNLTYSGTQWEFDDTSKPCVLVHGNSTGDFAVYTAAASANPAAIARRFNIDVAGLATLDAGQLAFPAAQNASSGANTLDDYEEGTWTPALGGIGGDSGTQAYSHQVGQYVKIGQLVYAFFDVNLSTEGTVTTGWQVENLPFTVLTNATTIGGWSAMWWSAMNTALATAGCFPLGTATVAHIYVSVTSTTMALIDHNNTTNTTRFFGGLVYRASA